ncbi:MAG: hypothetical protein ABWY03_10740 [Microbacterium sp.]
MDHDEIVRLYGPWLAHRVEDAARDFAGYRGRWWIAGGWAIEAFTGVSRPHADLDIGIPRADVALLREDVRGRFDVWAADGGSLHPLVGVDDRVADTCNNLWLRRSGADRWEYDILLTSVDDDRWVYRRDDRIARPLTEAVWRRDGVDYLQPEIQLLYKAPRLRPQDQADFDASRPLLSAAGRGWLRSALEAAHPRHPWIDALAGADETAP